MIASHVNRGVLFSIVFVVTFYSMKLCADENKFAELFIFGLDVRWLRLDDNPQFKLNISDQVTGGCWTNVDATRNVIELELKRSGYGILDTFEFGSFIFELTSLGYEVSEYGPCFVSNSISLKTIEPVRHFENGRTVASLSDVKVWSSSSILSGPKSDISSRIKEWYIEAIQDFLNQVDDRKKATLEGILTAISSKEQSDDESDKFEAIKKYWENR